MANLLELFGARELLRRVGQNEWDRHSNQTPKVFDEAGLLNNTSGDTMQAKISRLPVADKEGFPRRLLFQKKSRLLVSSKRLHIFFVDKKSFAPKEPGAQQSFCVSRIHVLYYRSAGKFILPYG